MAAQQVVSALQFIYADFVVHPKAQAPYAEAYVSLIADTATKYALNKTITVNKFFIFN